MSRFKKVFALSIFLVNYPYLVLAQTPAAPAAAPTATPSAFDSFQPLLPLILIFAVIYFLMIRPQQKQAKQRQAQLNALVKGQQVVTVGGIYGKVVGIADNVITLEIADNCKIKMERSGIQSIKKEE